MERYTKRLEDGQAVMDCANCPESWNTNPDCKCTSLYCRNRLKDRLAAYEDTGLEPEGIEQLKGEAFGLRMDKQVLEHVKRALAMMWFAYVNSDKETPHDYETEALEAAERILGPWTECMPKYLRRGQKED